jgi:hypothetical protein
MPPIWETDGFRGAVGIAKRLVAGAWRIARPSCRTVGRWFAPLVHGFWRWAGPVIGPAIFTGLHTLKEWRTRTKTPRQGERALLAEQAGSEAPALLLPSRTRVDVGYWSGKRRVWCCLLRDTLLLCAFGRRPYTERIAASALTESRYNHVTGELILSPAVGARCGRLRLAPLEGYELMSRVVTREDYDA